MTLSMSFPCGWRKLVILILSSSRTPSNKWVRPSVNQLLKSEFVGETYHRRKKIKFTNLLKRKEKLSLSGMQILWGSIKFPKYATRSQINSSWSSIFSVILSPRSRKKCMNSIETYQKKKKKDFRSSVFWRNPDPKKSMIIFLKNGKLVMNSFSTSERSVKNMRTINQLKS